MSASLVPQIPGLIPHHASPAPPSKLVLSDRLLHLAEDADRAGCRMAAEHLIALAHWVFDDAEAWAAPVSARGRRLS